MALVLRCIYNIDIPLVLVVENMDLYTALSTQRQSVDCSIHGDVPLIRHEFELGTLSEMIWVPGSVNLADVGTKHTSPLREAAAICLHNGRLPLQYNTAKSRPSTQSLG